MAKAKHKAKGKHKAKATKAKVGQTSAGPTTSGSGSAEADVTPHDVPRLGRVSELESAELAEEAIHALVEEFHGRLDESLIRAIASDHDDVGRDMADIRKALLPLAETAVAEEASSFALSHVKADSTAAGHDDADDEDSEYDMDDAAITASLPGLTLSEASPTEDTTTSPSETSAHYLDHESFTSPCQGDLTEDEKMENLLEIFTEFAPHTIRAALKQANGSVEKAFDDLFSRKYLLENGELAKGIDAFAVSDDELVRDPGRSKPSRNQPKKKVLPLAYSIKPTVPGEELLGTGALSKVQCSTTKEDGRQFQKPAVSSTLLAPHHYARPPLRLTPGTATVPVTVPVAALSRAAEPQWQTVVSRQTAKRRNRDRSPLSDASPYLSDVSAHNRRVAGEMQRRGGPYRAATGYYLSRAASDERAFISREAEMLVSRTSTAHKIDLHGVSVMDGVRIAKSRVEAWWDALDGENRARRAKETEFTIVTGRGNHSIGGISRLRQAVGTALRSDGWKVEDMDGQYFITGRV